MSGDEVLVLCISGAITFFTWAGWVLPMFTVEEMRPRPAPRFLAIATPIACLVALKFVLGRWSSSDVRDDGAYTFFYMLLGAAWLGLGSKLWIYLNLSARDDALERGNLAATVALFGGQLGVTFCYAGGNIGSGPGWWVVVFCGLLSTGLFYFLWLILDGTTGLSDAITIERDFAAGLRVAGLCMASGLVLGRAVAGDWISASVTLADFGKIGLPAIGLYVLAAMVEKLMRSLPIPSFVAGGGPALLYIVIAAVYVKGVGPW